MEDSTKILISCIGGLVIVAVTSLLVGYDTGVFESVKSAILIIAGYAIGKKVS